VELMLGAFVIAQDCFELVGSVHQGLRLVPPERVLNCCVNEENIRLKLTLIRSSSLMLASTECFSKSGNIRNAPLRALTTTSVPARPTLADVQRLAIGRRRPWANGCKPLRPADAIPERREAVAGDCRLLTDESRPNHEGLQQRKTRLLPVKLFCRTTAIVES
jgi:hypothetical protein